MKEGTFVFEYQPEIWPLPHPHQLHALQEGDSVAELVCFPDGHLALLVTTDSGRKEHHFQRVNLRKGQIFKFAFGWDSNSASAAAGGEMLATLEGSKGTVLDVKAKRDANYEMGSVSIDREILMDIPREEWLFIETLGDVSRKIECQSRYELVRLSALLRQLLCDGMPLFHSINRKLRLAVSFEVANISDENIPDLEPPQTSMCSLYPDAQEHVVRVDLDRFLKLICVSHRGVDCTVGHVIDAVANAFGGVHLGRLRSEEDKALDVLSNELLLQDESAVLYCLREIGKVTLRALMPLVEAILKQYQPPATSPSVVG